MTSSLTIQQIKAARELLGWTARELAGQADVSVETIAKIEKPGFGAVNATPWAEMNIRAAFARAGLVFVNGETLTGVMQTMEQPECQSLSSTE